MEVRAVRVCTAPIAGGGMRALRQGRVYEVADDFARVLLERGAVVAVSGEELQAVVESEEDAPAEPLHEDAEEAEDSAPAGDGEPSPTTSGGGRPKMTAHISVWRDYASHLGIKTTGMKKNEIIGAIDELATHPH